MTADAFKLVFHVDIFLVALIATFALATLPRALARLSSAAEWKHGYILRSVRLESIRFRGIPLQISRPVINPDPLLLNEKELSLKMAGYASSSGHGHLPDEPYTYYSHTDLLRHASTRTLGSVMNFPSHYRSWSAAAPEMGAILRRRLSAGFSVGQALILGLYTAILMYASLLDSNPFQDPTRMGIVAMSQFPIVYILGTKNNIVAILAGMGYEKLNYLHRYVGLLLVFLSDFHALGYIYTWTLGHEFSENMRMPPNRMALVALIALNVIFFFSTSFWRHRAYNVFYVSHIIGLVVFLPAVYAHESATLPYIFAAGAAYILDRIVRLLKTRIFSARIQPIPGLAVTRINIPALNMGWRAGQHVRIRVLSSGMGFVGWAEEHPFTIANVTETPEGMVLLCKNVGRWTRRLYELAKVAGYGCEKGGESRSVIVMIDGPYGGPGHSVFASFSAAMFVVGGSGITFALSSIQDLIRRDCDNASRVKLIQLIWSIQDPSALDPLLPLLSSLIYQGTRTPLQIFVHYTRAADVPPTKDFLPPGLTLSAGRPKVTKVLDSVIERAMSRGSGTKTYTDITGVIVGVCGPVSIGDEVAKAVSAVDAGRRWAVGGIEIHEETFGW